MYERRLKMKVNWQQHIANFQGVYLAVGDKRVTWEYLGEGYSGDFNPKDKKDVPLLRFSCSRWDTGTWDELDSASYCTCMPVNAQIRHLIEGARLIMEAIQDVDYKHRLQELTYLNLTDFEK
jgi:hypothetical protein